MVWTVFLIPVVALICVFTFVTVDSWSKNRLKEREAFYRSETHQRMLDGSPESAEAVLALIREEEQRKERRQAESLRMGLKLGGLVTMMAGVGLGVFMYYLVDDEPIYLVGLIPFLIGVVLALYGFFVGLPERREA